MCIIGRLPFGGQERPGEEQGHRGLHQGLRHHPPGQGSHPGVGLAIPGARQGRGVGKHLGTKALLHETMLMDLGSKERSQVPEALCAPMQAARQRASDTLAGVELECFADIKKAHGQYKNHQTHT